MGGRGEGEERGVCVGDASRSGVVACQELCRISALQHDIPVRECRIQEVNDLLQLVWIRPTDQTDLEPIELFNVVSTITGLNFIGFRLVLRIRFGRFGWSKGSQSTTDGITPCNGRNHTTFDQTLDLKKAKTNNQVLYTNMSEGCVNYNWAHAIFNYVYYEI